MAVSQVLERGAIIGGSFVMPSSTEPSIKEQMFGTKIVEGPLSVSVAARRYFEGAEFLAQYPELFPTTGDLMEPLEFPDWQMHRSRQGDYYAIFDGPSGEVIVPVDFRAMGEHYIRTQ